MAVAVALAESSGNERARNTRRGADARGIWQVNVARDAHPDLASLNLYDPAVNARAAYGIWKSGGWGPWEAHTSNAYLFYMPVALTAVQASQVQQIITNPGESAKAVADQLPGADMLDAAQGALTLGYKSAGWIGNRNNWVRVAYVMLGTGLIWGGLLMVAGKPIAKTTGAVVGSVVPAGKAVKAATAVKAAGGKKT